MGIRPTRLLVLAVVFLIGSCSAQVAAPRPSQAPELTRTASPRATNASSDLLYMRSLGGSGEGRIQVVEARTGTTVRGLADGALSADQKTIFWPESVHGGTQTVIHVTDLATGRDLRTFTVDGYLRPTSFTGSVGDLSGSQLSRDGRHLVLRNVPYKNPYDWVTKLAVVETSSGAVEGSIEIAAPATYGTVAISPDGRSVFVDQFGEGSAGSRARVFDVSSRALVDLPGSALSRNGLRTPPIFTPDGRWMFRIDIGDSSSGSEGPRVIAVDLLGRRAVTIALSIEHKSPDFDKFMLWSAVLSPDASTLYAVNPALGTINEIDAHQMTLRRTAAITVARVSEAPLAVLGRLLFPVAEAKRYLIGGAAISPDGRTVYAVGHEGISVIDTATLRSRHVWQAPDQFDVLALSSDGLRLYAVDNMDRMVTILDAHTGVTVGEIKLDSYIPAIVRIDSAQ